LNEEENLKEQLPDASLPAGHTGQEPETETPQTDTMEVHHHSHTPRKKWTHYFWEFLMLFLAVFCGFLAEYQLEHKIERDREKQYIQSLMTDLKTDVTNIEKVQKQNQLAKRCGDSLYILLTKPDHTKDLAYIYYYGRVFSIREFFNMTDGTLKQLNNAGGLRLIHNKDVVDSLQSYQYVYSEIVKAQELKELQLLGYRDVMCRVFDIRVFETMVNGIQIVKPAGNPRLFSDKKELHNELLMKVHFVKRNNALLLNWLDELKQKSIDLQSLIKKKYHQN
jgi:hypothetical protein